MPFSVDYAGTITLRPKLYTKEPEVQYDETYDYVRRKLSSLSTHFTLIAEVTKSYNIHYHIVIKFDLEDRKKDCMKEFHKCFRNDNLVGFVNIRQIDDMVKWTDYLKKDLCHTVNATNRRPVIWDMYDIFDSEERATFGVTW